VSTDVSEEHIVSIFRVEKIRRAKTSLKAGDKLLILFLPSLFFDPEVGGDIFLRNVG
jgi:hypothetical protein